jgi:hypothetical protein
MTTLKILIALSFCIDLILIVAYIELHAVMLWYKKQFESKPRAFRRVEKISWQRRIANTLLLRKPVSIKTPFGLFNMNHGKSFSRTEN